MGGQYYNLFGQKVASQYLAMGVLGSLFGGVYLASGGSSKTPATPPINASSSDEADFIKYGTSDSHSSFAPPPAPAPTSYSPSSSRIIIVPSIANTPIGSSSRPPSPPRSRLPLLPPPSTKVPENDSYDDRNGHEALRTGLVLCTYIATG
ncbi:hypothetical protein B0H65DRAFT_475538 [Neurospora tetraspora]|uniref:Uncharacterized protein n=1 Tax=Neurospora tetraspora TaxID=94610 RepID=A0AAE0MNJ7_9PEZI|nr:hypothetical protein B0H65DRAFT_475538 [Neurospora tetraspora]